MIITKWFSNQLKFNIARIRIFDEAKFIQSLQKLPFIDCKQIENKNAAYDLFKSMFKTIVDQHALLKTKFIRGTHAPFMN